MIYNTYRPSPQLAEFVRYFWVLEGEASPESQYVHRSMADGCAELIFHYHGVFDELVPGRPAGRSFTSGLSGQSQFYRRFSIQQNFGIFGVYLYPFAIAQCFSFSGTELTNQMVDLKTLLGSEANALDESVMLAADNESRIRIVSRFLENRLRRARPHQPGVFEAIKSIIHTNGSVSVESLANQNAISTRQFERNFKHYSGFSPKLFSRIIRFQNALGQYKNSVSSLTEIAYECGYYDQSHFIHDFREFSGHNPKAYFSGQAEGTEWRND